MNLRSCWWTLRKERHGVRSVSSTITKWWWSIWKGSKRLSLTHGDVLVISWGYEIVQSLELHMNPCSHRLCRCSRKWDSPKLCSRCHMSSHLISSDDHYLISSHLIWWSLSYVTWSIHAFLQALKALKERKSVWEGLDGAQKRIVDSSIRQMEASGVGKYIWLLLRIKNHTCE